MDINKNVILNYTKNITEIWSKGNSRIETSLYHINVGDWTSYNYRQAMKDGGYKEGDSLGGKMFPVLYEI